jgi:hypothetical protein
MSDVERRSTMDDTAEASIEPTVSTLRFADGAALDSAAPFAAVLTPPSRVARGRQDEQVLFFFDPTGAATLDLCQELHDVVTDVYWSTVGSVTAALRRAASVTNRYLFEHNLNSKPSNRCYGGLSCAVLRNRDLFLLQAGPVWTCLLQTERFRCFPGGEKLAHLGIGPVADVRLNHVSATIGDTLLMASPALLQEAGKDGLLRVLPRQEVRSVIAGLGQFGGSVDFTALVARWERAPIAEVSERQKQHQVRRSEVLAPVSRVSPEARQPIERKPQIAKEKAPRPRLAAKQRSPVRERRPASREFALNARKKLEGGFRRVTYALKGVWHGVAAIGAGVVALGRWLMSAIGRTIRGMLPGVEQKAYRRVPRRPPPHENRRVLVAVALAIPVLVVGVVAVAHQKFAVESRFQGVMKQAQEQIALAQAAGVDSEEARAHWEEALRRADAAAALQPDDPSAQALREEVRNALDQLDQVERLTLTRLIDFGSRNVGRRLVLSDQALFVLDSMDGWGARVPLDRVSEGTDSQNALVLLRTGQQVEGAEVDHLVDCAWASPEGGRQSSALLVLEKDGGVVSYDPAWGSESGAPQLTRLQLSAPIPGRSVAVGTYEGQFYVLDAAESGGQIWRYRPQGNAYPRPPEPYFASPPEKELENAVDMAIDGHIYVLYDDGTVAKFLGGERQEFEIRDVPGGLAEVAGFAVDPRGSEAVYVADRGNGRVVELYPDGRFKAQFRTDAAFAALEALAVSEADGRLYVLDGGQLYVASLP